MKKTILITGSTDGIGKLAATKLAKDGHLVCIHGRNPHKVERTLKEIKSYSNNDHVQAFIGDLSSFSSTRALIAEVKYKLDSLDLLINNAGVFKTQKQNNEDRLDLRFVVNYLAPKVLTDGLHSLLRQSESPRILNLSSAAQAPISLKAMLGEEAISVNESYAQSKLALTMWSFYLEQQTSGLQVVAVNPGSLLNTRMVQEAYGHHWSPAEKGADILYDLSTISNFDTYHGKYFDNDQGKIAKAHPSAYDDRALQMLMEATQNLIKKHL